MRIVREIVLTTFCLAALAPVAFAGEKPAVAPPDVIARVHAAHTLFVANLGGSLYGSAPYRAMYRALAALPGVHIADSPAHADLIFEVWSTDTLESRTLYEPHGHELGDRLVGAEIPRLSSSLRIIDPTSRQTLWKTSSPVEISTFQSFIDRDFAAGATAELKTVDDATPHPPETPVPIPAQIRPGSRLFLQTAAVPVTPMGAPVDVDGILAQAFARSGIYTLVDSPERADVVIAPTVVFNTFQDEPSASGLVQFDAVDPKTGVLIWRESSDDVDRAKNEEDRLLRTLPHLMNNLKKTVSKSHI